MIQIELHLTKSQSGSSWVLVHPNNTNTLVQIGGNSQLLTASSKPITINKKKYHASMTELCLFVLLTQCFHFNEIPCDCHTKEGRKIPKGQSNS